MKIRLEGTQTEINDFLSKHKGEGQNAFFEIKSVSKFYPNKAFGFERSEPQKEGRVYLEIG